MKRRLRRTAWIVALVTVATVLTELIDPRVRRRKQRWNHDHPSIPKPELMVQ